MSRKIHELRGILTLNSKGFVNGVKKAVGATKELRQAWGKAGKDIGRAAVRMGAATAGFAGFAVKEFADFESVMVRVRGVTNTLGEQGAKSFNRLAKRAKEMGATTRFTATEAAEAMENLGLAGLEVQEIYDALPGALQLASAAQVDIATAADVAAKTMRSFGLEATDLGRINDTLVGTFTRANTDLRQLAEAIKPVGPVAASLGIELETVTAALAKLSDAGFQGSEAGTALRNILSRFAGAVPEVSAKLRKLGIDIEYTDSGAMDFIATMRNMEAAGLEAGEVMALFGMRGGPGMAALLQVGTDALAEFEAGTRDLEGIAKKLEQAQLDTIAGQFDLLKSAISGVVLEIGERLAPVTRNMMQNFMELTREQGPQMAQTFVDAAEALGKFGMSVITWLRDNKQIVQEFVGALFGIVRWIGEFLAQHPRLMVALAAFKTTGLLGINQAIASTLTALKVTVSFIWTSLIPALGKGAAAFFAMGTAAQAAWAAATLGISLLIVGIIKLIQHFDKVKAYFKTGGGSKIFKPFIDAAIRLRDIVVNAAQKIIAAFTPVATKISTLIRNDLLPVLKRIGASVEVIWGWFKKLGELFAELAGGAFDLMLGAASELAEIGFVALEVALEALVLALTAFAKGLETAINLLQKAVDLAKEAFTLGLAEPERTRELDKQVAALQERLKARAAENAEAEKLAENLNKAAEGQEKLNQKTQEGKTAADELAAQIKRGEVGGGMPGAGGAGGMGGAGGDPAANQDLANKIADAIQAKRDMRLDSEVAGTSELTGFIQQLIQAQGTGALSPDQVVQSLGQYTANIPGATPQASAQLAAGLNQAGQNGNLTPERITQLVQTFLSGIQETETKMQTAKEATKNLGQRFQELRQKFPNIELQELGTKFVNIRKAFMQGKISSEQFGKAMEGLKKQTDEAVKAAKRKEMQERREMMMRVLSGRATQADREAVARMRNARSMEIFDRQLENAFNNFIGLNRQVGNVNNNFQNLSNQMQNFGQGFQGGFGGGAGGFGGFGGFGGGGGYGGYNVGTGSGGPTQQQMMQALNSTAGQVAAAYAEIQTLQNALLFLGPNSEKSEDIEGRIQQLLNLIAEIQNQPPQFVGRSGDIPFEDPGLAEDGRSGNNGTQTVTVEAPNLTRMGNQEVQDLAAAIRELERREGQSI